MPSAWPTLHEAQLLTEQVLEPVGYLFPIPIDVEGGKHSRVPGCSGRRTVCRGVLNIGAHHDSLLLFSRACSCGSFSISQRISRTSLRIWGVNSWTCRSSGEASESSRYNVRFCCAAATSISLGN